MTLLPAVTAPDTLTTSVAPLLDPVAVPTVCTSAIAAWAVVGVNTTRASTARSEQVIFAVDIEVLLTLRVGVDPRRTRSRRAPRAWRRSIPAVLGERKARLAHTGRFRGGIGQLRVPHRAADGWLPGEWVPANFVPVLPKCERKLRCREKKLHGVGVVGDVGVSTPPPHQAKKGCLPGAGFRGSSRPSRRRPGISGLCEDAHAAPVALGERALAQCIAERREVRHAIEPDLGRAAVRRAQDEHGMAEQP